MQCATLEPKTRQAKRLVPAAELARPEARLQRRRWFGAAAYEVLGVLASAAWFGLATGLIEVGILGVWHHLVIATVLGSLQMNRHFPWMIPLAHFGVFLICGLPVAVLAAVRPGQGRRAANFLFGMMASFALLLMIRGIHPAAVGIMSIGLGYQVGRWMGARASRVARFVRLSLPIQLAAVGILGAVAFDTLVLEERRAIVGLPSPAPGAPNVLLVVLDTVRADRLSLYGYSRDTTPNLARLAQRGVVFGEARATAPWTLPSHASLFTGRWPHELDVSADRPLDTTYPTLAEFLASHGYATAGFVGNTYFCNSWYGLARGFLHYEDYYEQNVIVSPGEALRCTALGRWLIRLAGTAYNVRPETANTPKDAARVNHDFLSWLDSPRKGRPFFAFLNYIDAHDPYLTPAGFDRHFGLKPESPADVETIRTWHHVQKPKEITQRDKTLIRDAYDDCVAALDEQLGHLFATLDQKGVLDNTLVVITADHGEELGEHGLYGHGKSLYRPELRVPLLILGPPGVGVPVGRMIDVPVSLRDVAATIVDRAGMAIHSPFSGRSLAHHWESAESTAPGSPVLSELAVRKKASRRAQRVPAMRGAMASLVLDGKTYIRDGLGDEEMYDLAGDPTEADNLARGAASWPVLEHCRNALDRLLATDSARR
jgi:arylsulfatase A-like enzyme